MSLNPDRAKQAQEVIFSRKTNKILHPPPDFNSATVKLTHIQKHHGLQPDNKLTLNEHANNKISRATKDIGLIGKLPPILPHRSLLIIHKSFIRSHLDYLDNF